VDVGLVRGPAGVSGVYVGDGEMPEGYNVQIDPNGAVFEMDTELDLTSQNPVTNHAITFEFGIVHNSIADAQRKVDSNKDKISVIETSNIGRDNKIESLEDKTDNLFDSFVSVDGRVTEIEIKQIEHNKVLWESTTAAKAGYNLKVPDMEKYHLFAVDFELGYNNIIPRILLYAGDTFTDYVNDATYRRFYLIGSQADWNGYGTVQIEILVDVSMSNPTQTVTTPYANVHEVKYVYSNGDEVNIGITKITGIC
jgi:hypothetical protein